MKGLYILLATVVTQVMSLAASVCDIDGAQNDNDHIGQTSVIIIKDGKQGLSLAANGGSIPD